jgi:hypothetical protein
MNRLLDSVQMWMGQIDNCSLFVGVEQFAPLASASLHASIIKHIKTAVALERVVLTVLDILVRV